MVRLGPDEWDDFLPPNTKYLGGPGYYPFANPDGSAAWPVYGTGSAMAYGPSGMSRINSGGNGLVILRPTFGEF